MLSRLIIRNYALIENLDIEFSKGLNIITGETGAGKSIMLGALSLILGQRIEGKYFYNQQKKCIIEGYFNISTYDMAAFFEEKELDYEAETVLRREVSADGKSRAFINDTPVNLGILKELGERLIDIHSQHATLELNDERFQLMVVDALAGNEVLLGNYRQQLKAYRKVTTELDRLEAEIARGKADAEYYQFQFSELEEAGLQEDEQERLESELKLLSNAEEIKTQLLAADYLLSQSDDAIITRLKEAAQSLQQVEAVFPAVSETLQRLESNLIDIKDIAEDVSSLEQKVQINEARTSEIGERLSIIYSLQKKHHVNTIRELMEVMKGFDEKLQSLGDASERLEKLKAEQISLRAEMLVLSDHLSASRNSVISTIESRVMESLADTGMPHAVLKIENKLLSEQEFDINGRNKLTFLFSANKGQEPAPVNRVASGGELSRLMLSIKALISLHISLPAIIFDEIDTGISGEVALKVGSLLEKLSAGLQVIAITHLPQIAARGRAHYKVFKDERPDKTYTNIELLSAEERVVEIAKMLSGENPGEYALQHARELLA